MKDQIEFVFNSQSSNEPFCPPQIWYGLGIDDPTMEEMTKSNRELEQLFQESEEYDFLMGKTSWARFEPCEA
jgi:hypothetical protein